MEETQYQIEFYNEDVIEELASLPKSAQKMIKKAIEERLQIDPIKLGKPLRGSLVGHKRLRVSVYRIVYRVDAIDRIVTVTAIDYRRDVYE